MKAYIDYCFEKKSYYKSIGDKNMSLTFKILMNSLFGVFLTRVEKFKDFKIVTQINQVNKYTSKPNYITRNIVNEDLSILEMAKISVTNINRFYYFTEFKSTHDYLYNHYPRLFGDDYQVLYMDTDSIYSKLNISHEKYLEIVKDNKVLFGEDIGKLNSDHFHDKIKECIFLSSKCYSYICNNDVAGKKIT